MQESLNIILSWIKNKKRCKFACTFRMINPSLFEIEVYEGYLNRNEQNGTQQKVLWNWI